MYYWNLERNRLVLQCITWYATGFANQLFLFSNSSYYYNYYCYFMWYRKDMAYILIYLLKKSLIRKQIQKLITTEWLPMITKQTLCYCSEKFEYIKICIFLVCMYYSSCVVLVAWVVSLYVISLWQMTPVLYINILFTL